MKKSIPTGSRVLSIVANRKGFGFALLEGKDTLVETGGRSAKGDKNSMVVKKVDKMISLFAPEALILEDALAKESLRRARVRELTNSLAALAKKRGIKVVLVPRERMKSIFLANGDGAKQDVAEAVAKRFPEQLAPHLPHRRKAWESEDPRFAIFDAIAFALACF